MLHYGKTNDFSTRQVELCKQGTLRMKINKIEELEVPESLLQKV